METRKETKTQTKKVKKTRTSKVPMTPLIISILALLFFLASLFIWPGWTNYPKNQNVKQVVKIKTLANKQKITEQGTKIKSLIWKNLLLAEANDSLTEANLLLAKANSGLIKTNAKLVKTNHWLVGKIKCLKNRSPKPQTKKAKRVVLMPTPTVKKSSKPVALVSITTTRLNPSYYEGGSSVIYFCVNLGENPGRYLPHLAILSGKKFGNSVQANNQGGYNFAVQSPSPKMTGDWGVTETGVFFISKKFIDHYLIKSDRDLVEIKTTITDWKGKQLKVSGNYYIYKP